MSNLGNIELYNIIINDSLNTISHINNLSENAILTNGQISELILSTENNIVSGATTAYDNLNEITTALSTNDVVASNALSTNYSTLEVDRVSMVGSFETSILNDNTTEITLMNNISTLISTVNQNDFLNDNVISTHASTQIVQSNLQDQTLATEITTLTTANTTYYTNLSNSIYAVITDLTDDNTTLSNTNSNNLSTITAESNTNSTTLFTQFTNARESEVTVSNALNSLTLNADTRSTELSTALKNENLTALANLSTTNYNNVTRSTTAFNTQSGISIRNNDYSTELVNNYITVSNELYAIDVEVSASYFYNNELQTTYSDNINEVVNDMNDSFSTSKHQYSSEEFNLSNIVSTNDLRVTSMKNVKADASNPLIVGSLLLNSEGNELKIGDNWALKATTINNKSSLSFYYNGTEKIPFMAIGVNNTEYHAGSASITQATNNTASSMSITSGTNNLSDGVTYDVYAILEDGLVDNTTNARMTYDASTTSLSVDSWNNVTPRKGNYEIRDDGSLVAKTTLTLEFFQAL